ncbi:hypothetical protein SO802_022827 [Lithocarpus litseifolius]|uniref:Uncharacterized protein n=1 Tax=Lithocarpus litseifolius TaxID=425828 RepID=A0AAW2C854_9ROSI
MQKVEMVNSLCQRYAAAATQWLVSSSVDFPKQQQMNCLLVLLGIQQVVKGEGNISGYAHTHPTTNGSKWSREERFRSNANGFWSTNKQQQSNGINRGCGDIGVHDSRMSPNDLRLKLINKRKMKRIPRVFKERRKMDQSQKLSKTIQPVEDSHTVTSLLQSLALGKYNILFRAEEVDRGHDCIEADG